MKSKLKRTLEKNREDIIMTMPGFINQLLLLMNSGVTAQEAFEKSEMSTADFRKKTKTILQEKYQR